MQGIEDFLTRFALVGATVLSAAWLAITGVRWLTRAMAAIRPYLAAFVIFTFVAMNYAQKPGGTNAPLCGASVELIEKSVECRVESVELRSGQSYNSTLYTLNSQFRLDSVVTNDSFSFSMPSNGERYANWWLRDAYEAQLDGAFTDIDGAIAFFRRKESVHKCP